MGNTAGCLGINKYIAEIGLQTRNPFKEVKMSDTKVREYLDQQQVKYTVIEHSAAYTAQEIAASAHIPGRQLAKTVMVKIDDRLVMAVLPATSKVDFEQLKTAIGAYQVQLASEQEFKELFPDCEVGAMPPFGNLYGLNVVADSSLADEIVIAFCAGTHIELIQLSYQDFEDLANPQVVDFSKAE